MDSTTNIIIAISAGIAVLVSILSTVLNVNAFKKSDNKEDLKRIYDKLDVMKDDYHNEDEKIVIRVNKLENTVHQCQLRHAAGLNGFGNGN